METQITLILLSTQSLATERLIKTEQYRTILIEKLSRRIDLLIKSNQK